jgi:hypothetical protein
MKKLTSLWLSLRLLHIAVRITPIEHALLNMLNEAKINTIWGLGVQEFFRRPTKSRLLKLLDDLAVTARDNQREFKEAASDDLATLLVARLHININNGRHRGNYTNILAVDLRELKPHNEFKVFITDPFSYTVDLNTADRVIYHRADLSGQRTYLKAEGPSTVFRLVR